MFRKELLELLKIRPYTLSELAEWFDCPPKEISDALKHLRRSLAHQPMRLEIEPARCRSCGFVFSRDKLKKPGKCPKCRRTWISEPRVWVISGD